MAANIGAASAGASSASPQPAGRRSAVQLILVNAYTEGRASAPAAASSGSSNLTATERPAAPPCGEGYWRRSYGSVNSVLVNNLDRHPSPTRVCLSGRPTRHCSCGMRHMSLRQDWKPFSAIGAPAADYLPRTVACSRTWLSRPRRRGTRASPSEARTNNLNRMTGCPARAAVEGSSVMSNCDTNSTQPVARTLLQHIDLSWLRQQIITVTPSTTHDREEPHTPCDRD